MYFLVYYLNNCPFSQRAENLLKEKFNNENLKFIKTNRENKDKLKEKIGFQTFPYIELYCDSSIKEYKKTVIGGSNDLIEFLDKYYDKDNMCKKISGGYINNKYKTSNLLTKNDAGLYYVNLFKHYRK